MANRTRHANKERHGKTISTLLGNRLHAEKRGGMYWFNNYKCLKETTVKLALYAGTCCRPTAQNFG